MEMDKQIQQQENPHETSITVREIQMKIIMSVHFLPIRMAMRQTLMGTWRSWKVVRPVQNVQRCSSYGRRVNAPLVGMQMHTQHREAVQLTPGTPPHCKQQEELHWQLIIELYLLKG